MDIKIIIITSGLSRIVQPIIENYNVVGIIESAPRNYKKISNIKVIIKEFLNKLRRIKSLKEFCKQKNIPYFLMTSSDISLEKWVKDKNPDVIIMYSMSQLLKENIFTIPKYGTINLHPALLPKYRGPNPWFWQYYNMEKKFGITLHFIDNGEDTGDIIYQEELDVPLGMKSPTMHDIMIGGLGLKMIFKALENIKNLPRKSQPKVSPTKRARNILPEEHNKIIEWNNWKIERIWHVLRGTELWLNAIEQPKGIYKGQRWIIANYEKCNISNYSISNVYKENGKYFVACKDGKIYLDVKFNLKNFFKNIIKGIIK